jgi:hypothetical protein
MTIIALFSLPTLFNAAVLCTTSVLQYLFFPKRNKEGRAIIKLKLLGHSDMKNM